MAKTKKCHGCQERYPKEPWHPPFRNWCSPVCGVTIARAKQDKARSMAAEKAKRAHRAETIRRKVALKTRADWTKETQREFNRYIRARDWDQPCVSCKRHHDGQYHAGHYRTTAAAPELRFNEINCHRQCAPCNNHLSGNIPEYRINLIGKIGLSLVEWIEGNHNPMRPTIDELRWLKTYYRQRANEAEKYANG